MLRHLSQYGALGQLGEEQKTMDGMMKKISEGSSDTKNWSNDAGNSTFWHILSYKSIVLYCIA